MNILILQGSPRANENTAWMAEEYCKAAEAAGHKVTLVDVAHKKIAGCMACEYCHGKGNGACVQKDYMQELYHCWRRRRFSSLQHRSTTLRCPPRFRYRSSASTT